MRAIELNRGIRHEIDAEKLANLKAKYSRSLQKYDNFVCDDKYYEASGNHSHSLLIKMECESAWWTGQLAKKASKLVFSVMGVFILISMLVIMVGGLEVEGETATTTPSEIVRRAYGLAICLIVVLDIFRLGWNYHQLSMAARESMKRLTALLDRDDDLSVPSLMTTVSDYQSVRSEGPLIPDWFKHYHENSLQCVWDKTLSMQESQD